ncbi:calcium-translocating P-type ATPase, PMCA-type [Clostridium sp. YIM B02505]|uniref:P-type Ca(2+) transporter n=1 Tax=Clostridium yunnanense TaxID=2800325 RepID=A0ABS1EWD8_9CLOT|nr:calcium-translocating P-type ATPase, PMCA-type [Clostridium yunnanense]MBK1813696.1 calcium-translocating P-type ATPase, PMCA-type [Clostridium yunnanense]
MWYTKNTSEVLKDLNVDESVGLSTEEAEKRIEKYGENKLASKKKKSIFQLFVAQLADFMIYILLAAALISGIMGEISDAIIIIIVILVNAVVGVVQESKAEKALEALKELSTPKAVVKRNGELTEIPSEQVVPGDIVIIDAGRYIPADLRLIESANLKMEESAFTGESVPADKDANAIIEGKVGVGDQHNMVFMSTLATYGRGVGVVVGTGMDTEIGKIAKMLDEEVEDSTPLQKKLEQLGKYLGIGSIGICFIIFIVSMFQKRDVFEMLLTSISLAVAAIPEGLPAIVAIVLAMGVQRMIKENAIIRKLPAVETLGSVNIICSDKTGTLTQNKMTVTKFYANDKLLHIEDLDFNTETNKLLIECMMLCNDATYSESSKTGDPTEIALLEAGFRYDITKDIINSEHKRIDEVPFDSDRKLMSTVNSYGQKYKVFTKGAIDSILKISTKLMLNGEILDLTENMKKDILKAVDLMSDDALRVLAGAYKDIDAPPHIGLDEIENNLTFIGMVGMIDPPRLEVKDSISLCKKAGITPVMITGDYKNTAFAIAKELGIADSLTQSISGEDIDKLNDEDFSNKVRDLRVFARVSPEHKVKIVKAFKAHGNIVSMTGDGVNDAPSLKAADIGVAMGITGTDVAKGAADMVLTDDNFTTIVSAVEEGRNIFSNIKKSIVFLLSCNLGEIITLFVAILLNWDSPLLPIHLLWVNLITDSLPALALGVDPGDKGVMDLPPRNPKESIFGGRTKLMLPLNGILIGGLTLVAFRVGEYLYPNSVPHARTMAFVVLSVSQLFYALSIRNDRKSIFQIGLFSNRFLIIAIIIGIILQASVITITPIAELFKVYSLTFKDWGFVILLSLVPLLINELFKIILRNKEI